MTRFSTINLDELPFPDAVETLNIEHTLEEQKAFIIELMPELASTLALESEPATKILELLSYQITVLKQRINSAVKATMLAYATGSDLDHRATDYSVQRLVLTEADPNAYPPIERILESDDDLRRRTQLALEGLSTAGPAGAYIFHSLSAHSDVIDASATSPSEGRVNVYILSRSNNGLPEAEVLNAVDNHLSHDDIKPLTDHLQVLAANIISYQLNAKLYFENGPDKAVVKALALKRLALYLDNQRLGRNVTLSGIYASLHVSGIQRVELLSPIVDIIVDQTSAAYCSSTIVTDGDLDNV
jgi:phage-related baseplate assembly protein